MPRLWSSPNSLEHLRRSTRLALFALVVFVLRVGMVTACAPSDFAELMPGMIEVAAQAETGGSTPEPDPEHGGGHCMHCSCHHVVTLPGALAPIAVESMGFDVITPPSAQANAPPELSLRPPIV